MSAVFWADQIAKKLKDRKQFNFLKKPLPETDIFTVKTSASISGILHIGRLSDTIRGESVVRALSENLKTRFIWVAEDMDPFRKVPKGVPSEYEEYLGLPVTDVPDPWGCHNSYAEHHISQYFKVLDMFVKEKMETFSMRQEYRKGSFKPYIKKLMDNTELVKKIQDKYRSDPLPGEWIPWKPICKKCGKIITTDVLKIEDGKVHYRCGDYNFESSKAKGCGYAGEADPLKDAGKLLWKSEWASQWARWKVVSEGAGKEYQVPMSAWWVNAEIVENVFDWPMPEPIFYEHIVVDKEKMSASKGNVIYPKEWLSVAEPEVLRFLYNKKLMKTRSFSWKDLPNIYDDFDEHEKVYFGIIEKPNKKEAEHMKRLYEFSCLCYPKTYKPKIPYKFAAIIGQISTEEKEVKDILSKTYQHVDPKAVIERIKLAKTWIDKFVPEERIVLNSEPSVKLTEKQKSFISQVIKAIEKSKDAGQLEGNFYEAVKQSGMGSKQAFSIVYQLIINKSYGPRLAPFVFIIGKEKAINILEKAVNY